jgi:hypothetical protein
MDALIIASVIGTAVLVIPLAVVVHGIRRQERAGLASRDAGLCAALTRKLIGLSGTARPATRRAAANKRHSSSNPARRDKSGRPVLVTGAQS